MENKVIKARYVTALSDTLSSANKSLNNIRLCAAEFYGLLVTKSLELGDHSSARQYAVEAWHYASLTVGVR